MYDESVLESFGFNVLGMDISKHQLRSNWVCNGDNVLVSFHISLKPAARFFVSWSCTCLSGL